MVFACSPAGIVDFAQSPILATTTIPFKVGYAIESLAPQAEYINAVEDLILVTAVAGALQCNTGGPLFDSIGLATSGRTNESRSIVPIHTVSGESCVALISKCSDLETTFQVVVNEVVDPEVAAFLGYVLLRQEMDSGAFVEIIPIIDRIEYLRPLPLLPPIVVDDDRGAEPVQGVEPKKRISVSPWSLGAVSTICKSR